MRENIITVCNLRKSYGKKIVTNNISVTMESGQIVAVVGHNGAGKTTFLNQLNGLVKSDSGEIVIKGENITISPSRARELVSSMPQFQVPLKGVTIQEAIECIGVIKGLSNKDARIKTDRLISFLNIEKWNRIKGENLSGGLQRLTSFAMAVIDDDSAVLVLDEPTNDVDPLRRILIWKYLRELADKGKTIVIVSHNLFEVERYADRYLIMDKGSIIKDITIADSKTKKMQHLITITGIDEINIKYFEKFTSTKYDRFEKRLLIIVDEELVEGILSTIINLLNDEKLVSYEIKSKNLSDEYEELINEE